MPEREEAVGAQRPEFDVVLLLSLTKWVQLNWGDEGLKRLFRRAFRHLRPGGLLLLEPQPWESYRKRKGLTETTYRNYQRIRLRPEQFPAYLTSPEVGFERCELLGTPQHSSKGGTPPPNPPQSPGPAPKNILKGLLGAFSGFLMNFLNFKGF